MSVRWYAIDHRRVPHVPPIGFTQFLRGIYRLRGWLPLLQLTQLLLILLQLAVLHLQRLSQRLYLSAKFPYGISRVYCRINAKRKCEHQDGGPGPYHAAAHHK